MIENNIFRLDWDTGCMDVKIDAFFIGSTVAQIKKLCKLVRRHSTEREHQELLNALTREDKERKALLDALGELAYKKSELANSFFHTTYEPAQGWAEKRLIRERAQLKRAIEILTAKR